MKKFKYFLATACDVLVLMGATGLILPPSIYGTPPQIEDDGSPGQGDEHRADPCDHLPDPPGEAKGHEKQCPPPGNSGGVARGDFNGDGFADLAIGVPSEDIGTVQDAGAVSIIYGSATTGLTAGGGTTGIPASQFWHQNSTGILDSSEANDRFGAALASGDFNGDGFSDLAVGVPGETFPGNVSGTFIFNAGAVHILYGSATGLTATNDQFFDLSSLGLQRESNAEFGKALVWADFNGDGFGDLAIGAPNSPLTSLGLNIFQAGMLAILYGSVTGVTTAGHQIVHQTAGSTAAQNFGDTAEASDLFGSRLAAGDFNGDTFDDLVVGVPNEDFSASVFNNGIVQLIPGSATGLNRLAVTFLSQDTPGVTGTAESLDFFGNAVGVGDFNGDTFQDLAVGAALEDIGTLVDAGEVHIFYGSLNGITTTGYQLFRQDSAGIQDVSEENDWFGNALAAGDFNDDGFRDLAIGAPQETINNVFAAGAVHVIYGSASGLSATAGPGNQFFRQGSGGLPDQPEQFDYFGSTLSAWNFGANYVIPAIPGVPPIPGRIVRAADLAIGVARESVVNSNNVNVSTAGVVHVLYGSTGGLATAGGAFATDDQLWHQDVTGIPDSVESGDFFGSALY